MTIFSLQRCQLHASHTNIITLNDGMGKMRHRKTRAILMTHQFSSVTESQKHCHAELMLHMAWCNEEGNLLCKFETYSESYASRPDEISDVKNCFCGHSESVLETVNNFDNGPLVSAWDAPVPEHTCAREGPAADLNTSALLCMLRYKHRQE